MTEQLKAEAYVREQRPALKELSEGCRVEITDKDNFPYSTGFYNKSGKIIMDGFHVGEFNPNARHTVSNSVEIIGHPINLQDWLAVLGEMFAIDSYGNTLLFNTKNDNYGLVGLRFNLTTGQPATEADYKAFNQIVNV